MKAAIRVEAAGAEGQDRAAAFPFRDGQLLVIADGAGGVAGGAEAAEAVIDTLRALDPGRAHDWVEVLERLDATLSAAPAAGETTAAIAFVTTDEIVGASVGDSGAWMLAGAWRDLTESQHRKPLLGTGGAMPVGFGPFHTGERLLLASDGLFKYVDAERIRRLARTSSPEDAASAVVQAARLRSGALQDDIAVVIAG